MRVFKDGRGFEVTVQYVTGPEPGAACEVRTESGEHLGDIHWSRRSGFAPELRLSRLGLGELTAQLAFWYDDYLVFACHACGASIVHRDPAEVASVVRLRCPDDSCLQRVDQYVVPPDER